MSDKKKTAWGMAPDANAPQDKESVPTSAGAAVVNVDSMTDQDDGNEADGRGRNRHVLPGILGKQLRAAYGELLNAPVPDAIADLIKKLETAQPGRPAAKKTVDEESGK